MAAIISDKFRIFNAKQFLESLSEGATDTSADRSRMYFFVGRPQPWKAYLEIYAKNATAFSVGDEVYVGTYGSTSFRATISKVYDSALLLTDVFGSAGVNSAPALGSSLKGRTGGVLEVLTQVPQLSLEFIVMLQRTFHLYHLITKTKKLPYMMSLLQLSVSLVLLLEQSFVVTTGI